MRVAIGNWGQTRDHSSDTSCQAAVDILFRSFGCGRYNEAFTLVFVYGQSQSPVEGLWEDV